MSAHHDGLVCGPDTIRALMRDLDGLLTAEAAATRLVLCGAEAVAPLRHYLLDGRPSQVFQPRRWAVRALAGLGAREALLEFIRCRSEVADPQARLGEEVVLGEAALHLATAADPEVADALLDLADRHAIPAVLEALARLGDRRALPLFVRALEDDFVRPTAERVIAQFGPEARAALIEAAISITPERADESDTSRRRRRSALDLLKAAKIEADAWRRLRRGLEDPDCEIRVKTAALVPARGSRREALAAADVLLASIRGAPWFLEDEIEDALVRIFVSRLPDFERRLGERAAETGPAARVLRHVRARLKPA
jgi:HEAT repeat protein